MFSAFLAIYTLFGEHNVDWDFLDRPDWYWEMWLIEHSN